MAHRTLSSEQAELAREMLRHIDRWASFDGGGDEIFTTFGVTPNVFYTRVAQYLRDEPTLLPGRDVEAMIAFCVCKSRL